MPRMPAAHIVYVYTMIGITDGLTMICLVTAYL